MKKRHEQKLVVLALVLGLVFSLPFVLVFSQPGAWLGIPRFHLSIFLVWAASISFSGFILSRFYE